MTSPLIDATLARNEIELFELRNRYLSPRIGLFVIGESRYTFSGQEKDLFFSLLKRSGKLPDNTLVWEIELPEELLDTGDTVEIQNFARVDFASRLHRHFPDSIVFFQDIDEIPSLAQVAEAGEITESEFVREVPMRMYWRRANWELKLPRGYWRSPKVFRGAPPTTNLRSYPSDGELQAEPGAHFSFLNMNAQTLREKFKHYGHQEYNRTNLWSPQLLSTCDRYGVDHLGRADRPGFGLLTYRSLVDSGNVSKFAQNLYPAWSGDKFEGSILRRLLTAQAISIVVRKQNQFASLNETWLFSKLGFCAGIGLVVAVTSRILLSLRKSARRIGRRLIRQVAGFGS